MMSRNIKMYTIMNIELLPVPDVVVNNNILFFLLSNNSINK